MQIHGTAPTADASLAIFAHELLEPLAAILLAAQAADETANDVLISRELWPVVERQGRYLTRVIDQVMELGLRSHHKTVLSKEWFDLSAIIMEAVEAIQPRLIDRQHRLTVTLPSDSLRVLADALQMRQVVTNLLANAAKYTGCGGQIDLGLRTANGFVYIEVRDNGVGIPPELLPRVFDLFQQGESRASIASGLGIGLALVKSLVELHGGSVSAHSGGTGTGATFVVLLPQAETEGCRQQADVRETQPLSHAESVWLESALLDALADRNAWRILTGAKEDNFFCGRYRIVAVDADRQEGSAETKNFGNIGPKKCEKGWYPAASNSFFDACRVPQLPSMGSTRALSARYSRIAKGLAGDYDDRMKGVPGTLQEGGAAFAPTHWSVVLLTAQSQSPEAAHAALTSFCQAYWPPLYTFVRRRGRSPGDAQDLTQAFFAHLIERNTLAHANPEKGQLRTFLLGSLQHFLANEYDRAHALKRGGGHQIVSMDDQLVEAEAALGNVVRGDESSGYDRHWAATLVSRAWEQLYRALVAEGKEKLVEALKPFVVGGTAAPPSQEDVAAGLQMSIATFRNTLWRMRQRYRECVRAEVACTVESPAEIDEEMRYLLHVLLS